MRGRWLVLRLDRPAVSVRFDRPALLLAIGLSVLVIGALALSVAVGEYAIALPDLLPALTGAGAQREQFIVQTLRFPRALVAFGVGAALAASGALLQGLTRNPLAAPDIIGVSAGASLAAVTTIVLAPAVPLAALPFITFGGAFGTLGLVYLLAWQRGSSPIRLILVGIGVAAVAYALINAVIAFGQILYVNRAVIWMAGSVYGRSWEHLWLLLPWLVIFLPLALLGSRHLNVLQLGDELARGLGIRIEQQRGLLLLTSAALAGAAVAVAGPVSFVGLLSPHIARRLIGPLHGSLLLISLLIGGLIVVAADLIGRTLFAPVEIPCGVVTAVIGAPYLIWLLIRGRYV